MRIMKNELIERWISYTNEHDKMENILENTLKSEVHLSLNEFYVLYYLGEKNEHCIKLNDLCEYFHLSQSAMSRMMMRMEKSSCGAIERKICSDDKRGIYIHLTSKGEEKLNKSKQLVEQILQEINK